MSTLGPKLRELREQAGLSLRKAAMLADVDVAILSKMERGERRLTKELVLKLAAIYNNDTNELIISYLSDKILYEIENEELGERALKVAEKRIRYLKLTKE